LTRPKSKLNDIKERFQVFEEEGISLFTTPWVSGTRARSYFGAVHCEHKPLNDDVEEAFECLLLGLVKKAIDLGANCVVGLEINIDPFEGKFGRYTAIGTAADLEPLF